MFNATLALSPAHDGVMLQRGSSKQWGEGDYDASYHRVLSITPVAGRNLVLLDLVLSLTGPFDGLVPGEADGTPGVLGVEFNAAVNGAPIAGFNSYIDPLLFPQHTSGSTAGTVSVVRAPVYIFVEDGGEFTLDVRWNRYDVATFDVRVRGIEVRRDTVS